MDLDSKLIEVEEYSAPLSPEEIDRLRSIHLPFEPEHAKSLNNQAPEGKLQSRIVQETSLSDEMIDLSDDKEWSAPLTRSQIKAMQNIRLPFALYRKRAVSDDEEEVDTKWQKVSHRLRLDETVDSTDIDMDSFEMFDQSEPAIQDELPFDFVNLEMSTPPPEYSQANGSSPSVSPQSTSFSLFERCPSFKRARYVMPKSI